MNLTIKFLKEKFNQFNKEFFDNELPNIEIKISRTKYAFGQYHFRNGIDGKNETPLYIRISKYFDRSEVEVCNTLIHEMIHLYTSVKNLGRNMDPHGYFFQKKMEEINNSQNTYRISIKSNVDKTKVNANKTYQIIIFDYKGQRYFSRISDSMLEKDVVNRFGRIISNWKIVKTTNKNAETLVAKRMSLNTIKYTDQAKQKFSI